MEVKTKVNTRLLKRFLSVFMSLCMIIGAISISPVKSARADGGGYPNSFHFMTRSPETVAVSGNTVTVAMDSVFEEDILTGDAASYVPVQAGTLTITIPEGKNFEVVGTDTSGVVQKWVNDQDSTDWHYDFDINTDSDSISYSITAINGYTVVSDSWLDDDPLNNDQDPNNNVHNKIQTGTPLTSGTLKVELNDASDDTDDWRRVSVWTDINRSLRHVDIYSDGLASLVLNADGTATGTYNYVLEHTQHDDKGNEISPAVVSNIKAGTVTVSVAAGYKIESVQYRHRIDKWKDENDVEQTNEWDERGFYTDAPEIYLTFTPESGYRLDCAEYRFDTYKDAQGTEIPFGQDKRDIRSTSAIKETVDISSLPYHFEENSGNVHIGADFREWQGMATIAVDKSIAALSGNSLVINVADVRSAQEKEDYERDGRGTVSKVTLTVKERIWDNVNQKEIIGAAIAPVDNGTAYTYTLDIDDLPDSYKFELVPDYNKNDFDLSAKLTGTSLEQFIDVCWEDKDDSRENVRCEFYYVRDNKKLKNGNTYNLTFDNSNNRELRQNSETVKLWIHPDWNWIIDTTTNSATYDYSYLLKDRYGLLSADKLPKYTVTIEGAQIVHDYEWINKNDAGNKKILATDGDNVKVERDNNDYFVEFDRKDIANIKLKLSGDFLGEHSIPLMLTQSQWNEELKPVNGVALLTGFGSDVPEDVSLDNWIWDPFEYAYNVQEYHFYGLNLTSEGMVQNGNTFTVRFNGYDIEDDRGGALMDTSVTAGTMTITFPSDALVLGFEKQRDDRKEDGTLWNEPNTVWCDGLRFYTTADYVDVTFKPADGYAAVSRWRWECDGEHHQEDVKRDWGTETVWEYSGDCENTGTTWRVQGVAEDAFDCDDKSKDNWDNTRTIIDTEFRSKMRQIYIGADESLIGLIVVDGTLVATYGHDGYDDNGNYYVDPDIIAGTVTYSIPAGSKFDRVGRNVEFVDYDENGNVIHRSFENYFWTDADTITIKVEPTEGHKVYGFWHNIAADGETGCPDDDTYYEARTYTASLEGIGYGEGRDVGVDFGEYLGTISICIDGRFATVEGNTVTHYVGNTDAQLKFNVTRAEWDSSINGHVWVPFYPEVVDYGSYKVYKFTFDAEDRWDKHFNVENLSSLGISSPNELTILYGSHITQIYDEDEFPNMIDFSFLEEGYRDGIYTGNMSNTLSFSVPAPIVYNDPTPTPESTPAPTPKPTATPTPTPEPATPTPEPATPTPEPVSEDTVVEQIGNTTTTTTVTENEDGSTTVVEESVNKDGSSSVTTSTTVEKEDGSKETVSETINSDGTSSKTTETVIENEDGSVETVTETVNSDGTSSTTTATTVESEDGTKTTEAVTENSDGTTVAETKVENADGSSSSVSVTKDENGKTLATVTEEVSFGAKGTEIVETKVENADGSVTESVVKTTTSGKVVAQTAETDAKGNTTITLETEKTDGTDVVKTFTAEKDGIKLTEYQTEGKKAVIPATIAVGDEVYEVKTIGKNAFAGNTDIEKVTIPETVETIGQGAFAGATGLKSVNLANVTSISKGAFAGASNLKKITLGADINKIGKGAFDGIPKGATITIVAANDKEFEKAKKKIIQSGVKEGDVRFVRVNP